MYNIGTRGFHNRPLGGYSLARPLWGVGQTGKTSCDISTPFGGR